MQVTCSLHGRVMEEQRSVRCARVKSLQSWSGRYIGNFEKCKPQGGVNLGTEVIQTLKWYGSHREEMWPVCKAVSSSMGQRTETSMRKNEIRPPKRMLVFGPRLLPHVHLSFILNVYKLGVVFRIHFLKNHFNQWRFSNHVPLIEGRWNNLTMNHSMIQ